ncbi:hypothetical protein KFU94_38660 [Chloroflexi bacterium TSY]|nr:hypothetical protein [Chloroflexi bacterium TSY]
MDLLSIVLSVRDDGIGIEQSKNGKGFGLRGLEERSIQVGGSLHLESQPGQGVRLSFSVPIQEKSSKTE